MVSSTPASRGVFRADSLMALNAREDLLEMSDVVPVTASSFVELGSDGQLESYPFTVLTRDDSLGLSFEVYHLSFGADDQTHYTVEYEIARREPGGVFSLFRQRRDERTAT